MFDTGTSSLSFDFNPRSREGSDNFFKETTDIKHDFNPRSREGSDMKRKLMPNLMGKFQSTLPRGERHVRQHILLGGRYFNPRSREGSDRPPLCLWQPLFLFQSTLPRGERPMTVPSFLLTFCNFNPRSREGSDFNFI